MPCCASLLRRFKFKTGFEARWLIPAGKGIAAFPAWVLPLDTELQPREVPALQM